MTGKRDRQRRRDYDRQVAEESHPMYSPRYDPPLTRPDGTPLTTDDVAVEAPADVTVYVKSHPTATCPECGRTFDLLDPTDAAEWTYGHDCEAE